MADPVTVATAASGAHADRFEPVGELALVLHAHLPFVRHPEHPQFHEESWLFEAILECYLPLLRAMRSWSQDGLPWHLTLSVSPTLAAMLADPLLKSRFRAYLGSLQELAEREEVRAHFQPARRHVAAFYCQWLNEQRETYERVEGDLLAAWRQLADSGGLELITCSATHATLPLLRSEPGLLAAQLDLAIDQHEAWTGRPPTGFWLPECAWTPELESFLTQRGIRWSVLETHGILHATPRPRQAIYAPTLSPGGLALFGRDPTSARQVWSRHGGYPGDPAYREFHRDVAHDADWDYVRPYLHGAAGRAFTGLKFHRVTGPTESKALYDRSLALNRAREHAEHFVSERVRTCTAAAALLSAPPILLAPYDAELFGHWWFEGPEFLDALVREMTAPGASVRTTTPSRYLTQEPELDVAMPAPSTWGEGGHFAVWLDESNAWMQGPLRAASRRYAQLAITCRQEPRGSLRDQILAQALRELLLAQASDWPFLVKLNTAGVYPARRFQDHVQAFERLTTRLEDPVEPGLEAFLRERESRSPLFPQLDWRRWPAVTP